jgi:hypothetical protein
MLSLFKRAGASSIRVTKPYRPRFPTFDAVEQDGERSVDFYGFPVVFPDWSPEAEEEVRERLSHLKGLTNEGMASEARMLIAEYLDRDNPRNIPFADRRDALAAVSAHTWKVLRAKGMVCER